MKYLCCRSDLFFSTFLTQMTTNLNKNLYGVVVYEKRLLALSKNSRCLFSHPRRRVVPLSGASYGRTISSWVLWLSFYVFVHNIPGRKSSASQLSYPWTRTGQSTLTPSATSILKVIWLHEYDTYSVHLPQHTQLCVVPVYARTATLIAVGKELEPD